MTKEQILQKHAHETLVFSQHYNDHIVAAMEEYASLMCKPLVDALVKYPN